MSVKVEVENELARMRAALLEKGRVSPEAVGVVLEPVVAKAVELILEIESFWGEMEDYVS